MTAEVRRAWVVRDGYQCSWCGADLQARRVTQDGRAVAQMAQGWHAVDRVYRWTRMRRPRRTDQESWTMAVLPVLLECRNADCRERVSLD